MASPFDIGPKKNSRMSLALLLRVLADVMDDDDEQPQEQDISSSREDFRETGVRTRPDFMPWMT